MELDVTIRVATEQDADVAVTVLRRSITELCAADHRGDPATLEDWLANKTPERFRGWLVRAGQFTVVAERDGVVCGVGMLSPDGELRLCYVHPDHVGRGVGRALVAAIETEAKAKGLTRLHLDATETATAFYEAMGFQRFGPSTAGFGVTYTNPYEKDLVPADRLGR